MAKKEKEKKAKNASPKAKKAKKTKPPKVRVEMGLIYPVLIVILILVALFDLILGLYIWLNWDVGKRDGIVGNLSRPDSAQMLEDNSFLDRRTALEEKLL